MTREEVVPGNAGATTETRILLGTARSWFAEALRAVLEHEGYRFVVVETAREVLARAPAEVPDLVILDEGLPDQGSPELCRALVEGPLPSSVPILVYSANLWQEQTHARAMRAGAWDVIREPVRSSLLVAKLERLLRIRRLIESSEEALEGLAGEPEPLALLLRYLPKMAALAQRYEAPLTCAVFGPTRVESGRSLDRQREEASRLCRHFVRGSDLCAWIGDTDVVVIAYDADVTGATRLVQRLNERSEERADEGRMSPLSAGVVALTAGEFLKLRSAAAEQEGEASEGVASHIARLSRLAAAQSALREARESGGGIRVAEA